MPSDLKELSNYTKMLIRDGPSTNPTSMVAPQQKQQSLTNQPSKQTIQTIILNSPQPSIHRMSKKNLHSYDITQES